MTDSILIYQQANSNKLFNNTDNNTKASLSPQMWDNSLLKDSKNSILDNQNVSTNSNYFPQHHHLNHLNQFDSETTNDNDMIDNGINDQDEDDEAEDEIYDRLDSQENQTDYKKNIQENNISYLSTNTGVYNTWSN